jgi:hypothetical protein
MTAFAALPTSPDKLLAASPSKMTDSVEKVRASSG